MDKKIKENELIFSGSPNNPTVYKLYNYTAKTWDQMLKEQKLFDEE